MLLILLRAMDYNPVSTDIVVRLVSPDRGFQRPDALLILFLELLGHFAKRMVVVRSLVAAHTCPKKHETALSFAASSQLLWVLRETQSDRAALSAFQAAPRNTIIAEISIHTIKPIAAATPP